MAHDFFKEQPVEADVYFFPLYISQLAGFIRCQNHTSTDTVPQARGAGYY